MSGASLEQVALEIPDIATAVTQRGHRYGFRLLQRVQRPIVLRQPLHRRDLAPFRLHREREAGEHAATVEVDGAGAGAGLDGTGFGAGFGAGVEEPPPPSSAGIIPRPGMSSSHHSLSRSTELPSSGVSPPSEPGVVVVEVVSDGTGAGVVSSVVVSAGVVGVPDARTGGERLVAYVVPREGETVAPDEIAAHLAERLVGYKIPGDIRVVEALPMTGAQKLDRVALRRMAREAPAT